MTEQPDVAALVRLLLDINPRTSPKASRAAMNEAAAALTAAQEGWSQLREANQHMAYELGRATAALTAAQERAGKLEAERDKLLGDLNAYEKTIRRIEQEDQAALTAAQEQLRIANQWIEMHEPVVKRVKELEEECTRRERVNDSYADENQRFWDRIEAAEERVKELEAEALEAEHQTIEAKEEWYSMGFEVGVESTDAYKRGYNDAREWVDRAETAEKRVKELEAVLNESNELAMQSAEQFSAVQARVTELEAERARTADILKAKDVFARKQGERAKAYREALEDARSEFQRALMLEPNDNAFKRFSAARDRIVRVLSDTQPEVKP